MMNLKYNYLWIALILLFSFSFVHAKMASGEEGTNKTLDLTKHHNVGNSWLRVSNYGFFGAGSATPRWPSLEYPGGSGVDYLYQGALWFGAQKVRRDSRGREMYWKSWHPESPNPPVSSDVITKFVTIDGEEVLHPDWEGDGMHKLVVDTLTSVGFDGYWDIKEFLPAWNPLERNRAGYQENNRLDVVMETSTRDHRRGFDDDGDGLIDEDPVGRAFPFRLDRSVSHPGMGAIPGREPGVHLPEQFHAFSGMFIHELEALGTQMIDDNSEFWFPLGFQDLSYTADGRDGRAEIPIEKRFNFFEPWDDDGDGLIDEDGAPVSEQDFISYYYDYSPFDGPAYHISNRVHGSGATRNDHMPLNVRVRQMSYQWSYDYIKNLTYVEFNITNMNPQDILYNCVMGIYMDCDIGPQSWDSEKTSMTDVSGYVGGEDFEFAYSREFVDIDYSPHWIGARVCTPDPYEIAYAAWTYSRMKTGPSDWDPLEYFSLGTKKTANEKYWLLTGRNPDEDRFIDMRRRAYEASNLQFEEGTATDTRFLFAFFGDQKGYPLETATDESWNLHPFETMKIVVALFPGENLDDLKASAQWAKTIYGKSQLLHEVVLPDTFKHYNPPEPPQFPRMHSELKEEPAGSNNINLEVWWSNRSEFTVDLIKLESGDIGWNDREGLDSNTSNWDPSWPDQFNPIHGNWNPNAIVNPYTAWRVRHTFQGYTLWGRSGRGDRESWVRIEMWDKVDTEQDLKDYSEVNTHDPTIYRNLGGYLGIDKGLPNPINKNGVVTQDNISPGGELHGYCLGGDDCDNLDGENCGGHIYYKQGDDYTPKIIDVGDSVYGLPIYGMITAKQAQALAHEPREFAPYLTDQEKIENQLLFKHPSLRDDVYLSLVDDNLIPLRGHMGQNKVVQSPNRRLQRDGNVGEEFTADRQNRLMRRYYNAKITNLPKGREYYVSATAWSRGMPYRNLGALESGWDANMMVFFPGPLAQANMKNVYVVPNPYKGGSSFDGKIEGDTLGDKSRRLWFVNLPARANVQIYTLAGDLVDEFEHYPGKPLDVISISKAVPEAVGSGGIHPWDLLSKNNQIIASGLYFFSVKCHDTGNVQVGKFAVIR